MLYHGLSFGKLILSVGQVILRMAQPCECKLNSGFWLERLQMLFGLTLVSIFGDLIYDSSYYAQGWAQIFPNRPDQHEYLSSLTYIFKIQGWAKAVGSIYLESRVYLNQPLPFWSFRKRNPPKEQIEKLNKPDKNLPCFLVILNNVKNL
jgi:hypothetical protein